MFSFIIMQRCVMGLSKQTRGINKTYENKENKNKNNNGVFFNMNLSPLVLYSLRGCPLIHDRMYCFPLFLYMLALMTAC